MQKSRKRLLAVLVGALCVVIGLASVAFAGTDSDNDETTWFGGIGKPGAMGLGEMRKPGMAGMIRGFMGKAFDRIKNARPGANAVLGYISGKTGVPLETLLQELKNGKTLEEIAAAHGVDWADIEKVLNCDNLFGEMSEERLEAAIDRVTANKDRLTERMDEFESKIPEYEAKIAEIEDETLREFATRRLEIMKQRWALGDDHLSIMEQQLELLEDELDYAKSR